MGKNRNILVNYYLFNDIHLFIDRQNKSFLKIRFIFILVYICFACMQVYVCLPHVYSTCGGQNRMLGSQPGSSGSTSSAKPSLQPQKIDSLCHKKYIKHYSTRQRQCITMTKNNWGGGWGGEELTSRPQRTAAYWAIPHSGSPAYRAHGVRPFHINYQSRK